MDQQKSLLPSAHQVPALAGHLFFYLGRSYKCGDGRLLGCLPEEMQTWDRAKKERLARGGKRLFLRYTIQDNIWGNIEEIEITLRVVIGFLESLMHSACLIDGFAFGVDLEQVKAETLIDGDNSQEQPVEGDQ